MDFMISRPRKSLLFLLLAVVPMTGCLLFRSRTIHRQQSTAPLKAASEAELIDYINQQAANIQSMQATVDIDTSVEKHGKNKDYPEIYGYVLARKPAMLRVVGLMPVVHTCCAVDMVSNGQNFKLSIPPENRFVVGRNDVPTPDAKNPLENLRPQHIYDALLLRETNPPTESVEMQNGVEFVDGPNGHEMEQPDYEIDISGKNDRGVPSLSRKIVFSRTDLLPHRQIVYDRDGNLATDTRYEGYKDYNGVNFPSQIEVRRPHYVIVLHVVKLQLNKVLTNDQFELKQPPGALVIDLNQSQGASTSAKLPVR